MSASDASKILATLVLISAETREKSFDHGAAATAEAEDKERRIKLQKGKAVESLPMADFSNFYRLTIRQAIVRECSTAGHPDLVDPIYLMLYYRWNDAIAWARETIGIGEQHAG